MKYSITRDYIRMGNSRSGQKISKVIFIVSHDTGNPGSTAYNNRNYFDRQQPSASAHTFIDDKYILEIIPLNEKAWHVRYDRTVDNRLFGANANDAAIGVELCHGGSINFQEAYKRYVWYHAYLCDRFNLKPREHIVPHSRLDPERRTDPLNALQPRGITWTKFLEDVVTSLANDFGKGATTSSPPSQSQPKSQPLQQPQPQVKGVTTTLPLKKGDQGQFVKEIQQDLIKAGFSLPRYGADGEFGDETENAVRQFQRKYGLKVDGLVGPQTLKKLNEVVNAKQAPAPKKRVTLPQVVLRRGSQGENVRRVQRALRDLNFNPGKIDGVYGPNTESAVRRFQSMFKELTNDGVYGPKTRSVMERELNK